MASGLVAGIVVVDVHVASDVLVCNIRIVSVLIVAVLGVAVLAVGGVCILGRSSNSASESLLSAEGDCPGQPPLLRGRLFARPGELSARVEGSAR